MNKRWVFLLSILIIAAAFLILNTRYSNQLQNKTDDQVEVALYFSTQDAMYLKTEKRTVPGDNLYGDTLAELLKGPADPELNRTIPEGVEVKGVEIKDSIASINFNRALVDNHWGGSTGELMTVYSIVNTMTQFTEIDRVQILIEGERVETLVGHLDLSRPFAADQKLVKE